MSDDTTMRFYAENAEDYARHRTAAGGPALDGFLAQLPRGARILELGCGNGMEAAHMLGLGFDVDATDGTPGLVQEAQRRVGHRARLMRFDELDAADCYDGVWASASLLHVPAQTLPQSLAQIHRALRAGGVFVASFKAGTGEGRDGMGRLYNYPTPQALEDAYRAAGWTDLHLETAMGSGYDARPTLWLWMTARRQQNETSHPSP
jgi:SAM-dependent methyltransferase